MLTLGLCLVSERGWSVSTHSWAVLLDEHRWVLICRDPQVWRCSDWPRCSEMRFGKGRTGPRWWWMTQ